MVMQEGTKDVIIIRRFFSIDLDLDSMRSSLTTCTHRSNRQPVPQCRRGDCSRRGVDGVGVGSERVLVLVRSFVRAVRLIQTLAWSCCTAQDGVWRAGSSLMYGRPRYAYGRRHGICIARNLEIAVSSLSVKTSDRAQGPRTIFNCRRLPSRALSLPF